MLIFCGVISGIVLLAVFGGFIVVMGREIVVKIQRMAWTKTLVDFPTDKLRSELSSLMGDKNRLKDRYSEIPKNQRADADSELRDLEARIKILERLITERLSLQYGKK
jgi:hypothetical protein